MAPLRSVIIFIREPFSKKIPKSTLLSIRVKTPEVVLLMSLLSRLGLVGLGGGRLESEPLAGWRRRLQSLLRGMARGCFFAMGFHWVEVSGEQVIAERVFFSGKCVTYLEENH